MLWLLWWDGWGMTLVGVGIEVARIITQRMMTVLLVAVVVIVMVLIKILGLIGTVTMVIPMRVVTLY